MFRRVTRLRKRFQAAAGLAPPREPAHVPAVDYAPSTAQDLPVKPSRLPRRPAGPMGFGEAPRLEVPWPGLEQNRASAAGRMSPEASVQSACARHLWTS